MRETNGHVRSPSTALPTLCSRGESRSGAATWTTSSRCSPSAASRGLGLIFGLPGETEVTIAETSPSSGRCRSRSRSSTWPGARIYSAHAARHESPSRSPSDSSAPTIRLPEAVRLLEPVASTRAGAAWVGEQLSSLPKVAGSESAYRSARQPFPTRTKQCSPNRLCNRLLQSPTGRGVGPISSSAPRTTTRETQIGRDDRRLPPDRDMARAVRPRPRPPETPPPGEHPPGDVPQSAPIRPVRVRRLALADRLGGRLRRRPKEGAAA